MSRATSDASADGPKSTPASLPQEVTEGGIKLIRTIFFTLFLFCVGFTTRPATRWLGRAGLALLIAWMLLLLFKPARRFAMWPILAILTPWAFRKFFRIRMDGEVTPISSLPDHIPERARERWEQARSRLSTLQFRSGGLWQARHFGGGIGLDPVTFFEGFDGPEPGLIAWIYVQMSGALPTAEAIDVGWMFTDGRYLLVTTNADPRSFPRSPHQDVLAFPGVDDPAELLRLARAARPRFQRADVRSTPEGDWPTLFRLGNQRELSHWLRRGYIHPAGPSEYRATLKGTLWIALTAPPPIPTLLRARHRRRANTLHRRLLERTHA